MSVDTEPTSSQVRGLQEAMVAMIRAFGLHQPEQTPCGQPIPVSEARAVMELACDGALAQHELAARLRLQRGTVSRLVHQLEGRGWVARDRHDRDGRVAMLSLTHQAPRRPNSSPPRAPRDSPPCSRPSQRRIGPPFRPGCASWWAPSTRCSTSTVGEGGGELVVVAVDADHDRYEVAHPAGGGGHQDFFLVVAVASVGVPKAAGNSARGSRSRVVTAVASGGEGVNQRDQPQQIGPVPADVASRLPTCAGSGCPGPRLHARLAPHADALRAVPTRLTGPLEYSPLLALARRTRLTSPTLGAAGGDHRPQEAGHRRPPQQRTPEIEGSSAAASNPQHFFEP